MLIFTYYSLFKESHYFKKKFSSSKMILLF